MLKMLLLAVVKVIFFSKLLSGPSPRLVPYPNLALHTPTVLFCDYTPKIPLILKKTCSKMAYRFKVHISKISLSALILYKSSMFLNVYHLNNFFKK